MPTTFKTRSRVYVLSDYRHADGSRPIYKITFGWLGRSSEEVGRANNPVAAGIFIEVHARERVVEIDSR